MNVIGQFLAAAYLLPVITPLGPLIGSWVGFRTTLGGRDKWRSEKNILLAGNRKSVVSENMTAFSTVNKKKLKYRSQCNSFDFLPRECILSRAHVFIIRYSGLHRWLFSYPLQTLMSWFRWPLIGFPLQNYWHKCEIDEILPYAGQVKIYSIQLLILSPSINNP
jgi:hypothetical protein